jgi:hypothetical protein
MDDHKGTNEHKQMMAMSWTRFLAMISTSTFIREHNQDRRSRGCDSRRRPPVGRE